MNFNGAVNTFVKLAFVTLCFKIGFAERLNANESANENESVKDAVQVVKRIGANGAGHDDAVTAMKVLNSATPDQIPIILEGMDGANELVANWLRAAVVKITGDGSSLPREKIRTYFDNKDGAHLGRLLAFDLLTDDNSDLKAEIVPTLIDDPSLPLRYKAIADLIEKSKSAEPMKAIGMLGVAVEKARNVDQVVSIAKQLNEKGISVDLQKQLGFINQWNVVGNFDNKDEKGFEIEYGPEKTLEEFDANESFEDSVDKIPAIWKPYNTTDPMGIVDLNEVIGKTKGVLVYAHGTFDSDEERTVDIRIGCINAHKVWVNGKLVMSNEIYHNGISPDKFVTSADLVKGKNDLLIKVCQNEQTQSWAQRWQFQIRICDETGKAIRSESKPSTRPGA